MALGYAALVIALVGLIAVLGCSPDGGDLATPSPAARRARVGADITGDTLPPLANGPPGTVEELWAGYDPRREPLDVEILREWEEEGVACRVLRYRVGVFKGARSMICAIYGFPKGGRDLPGLQSGTGGAGRKLPGLVQVHGGGQMAHLNAVVTNARRGYACISVNWAANPLGGLRHDGPNTDWGRVDATQKTHNSHFGSLAPDEKTVDAVESPRNNNWFLIVMAARRALTFLERRPEVDGSRLGIYGHSMGAKISFDTAAVDERVKACAPSCGAQPQKRDGSLHARTIATGAHAPLVRCPVVFLNPSNDFHGTIDSIEETAALMASVERQGEYRYTRVPHLNHRTKPEHVVCGLLWFDQHLKGAFRFPRTPESKLVLNARGGDPALEVAPDEPGRVLEVDVYYTTDDEPPTERFWRHAEAVREGDAWRAALPLASAQRPLRAYANVLYPLDEPVTGASYYYQVYTAERFSIASRMHKATPEALAAAGARPAGGAAALGQSLVIERFEPGWRKEWYTFDYGGAWPFRTRKLATETWRPPAWARLAIDVRSERPNSVVLKLDEFAAEAALTGGADWQTVEFYPADFSHEKTGAGFINWRRFAELAIAPDARIVRDGEKTRLGGDWQGPPPELRDLRWVETTREDVYSRRTVKLEGVEPVDGRTYLDFRLADEFTHGYKAEMNRSCTGKPLSIGGKTYERGIGTHAPSEAVFFLGGKYRRFHAEVGADDAHRATVVFRVFLDGRKVYDSGPVTRGPAKKVDLAVEDAQELRLVVTDGGNGKGGDHADWADAYVEP